MSESNVLIAQWRQRLLADETMSDQQVAELEDHLRETAAAIASDGLSAEEALHVAMMRVGKPSDVHAEYIEADPGAGWRRRAMWILGGAAGFYGWYWVIDWMREIAEECFVRFSIAGDHAVALRLWMLVVMVFVGWRLLKSTLQSPPSLGCTGRWSNVGFVMKVTLLGALASRTASQATNLGTVYALYEWWGPAAAKTWAMHLAFSVVHYALPAGLLLALCMLIGKRGSRRIDTALLMLAALVTIAIYRSVFFIPLPSVDQEVLVAMVALR